MGACAAGLSLPSFPQHTVRVKYATEHRCGVAVSGPDLSDAISGTDPLKDRLPLQVCLCRALHHCLLLYRQPPAALAFQVRVINANNAWRIWRLMSIQGPLAGCKAFR